MKDIIKNLVDRSRLRAAPPMQLAERQQIYFARARAVQRVLAVPMLVLASPLILLLMAAVKLTSRGPAIYSQRRVGLGGKQFNVHKLRTMRVDAEAKSGPVWATSGDPRVTFLGNIFRKLHLDELPQLWNVFQGEMLLVGPRPERPEFTRRLAVEVPGYLDRLIVMPGITGLAQINLPPDIDNESVRRKLILDLEYARHAGLGMDLRIIICTALRLAYFSSRPCRKLFGVYRDPHKLVGEPAVLSFRVHREPAEIADDDSSFDIPVPRPAGATPGA